MIWRNIREHVGVNPHAGEHRVVYLPLCSIGRALVENVDQVAEIAIKHRHSERAYIEIVTTNPLRNEG